MAPLSATFTILYILLSTTTLLPTTLALPRSPRPNIAREDTQQHPFFPPPPTHPWSFWLYATPQCKTQHHSHPITSTPNDPNAFSTHAGHDNRRCEKINLGVPALGYKTTSGHSGITGEGIAPCSIRFYNDADCKEGSHVGALKLSSECQQPKRQVEHNRDGKEEKEEKLKEMGKDEVLAFSVHC